MANKEIGFDVKVGGLDQAKQAFGQALDGVNIFGQGLSGLFKVILTNPIGLIITALAGLIAAFKKLDPVVDFMEQALAGLNAVFDTLIGSIGGFIKDLFNGKGIVDAFTNNIANMGEKMVDAYNAASDLAKAVQELEDAQNAYTVSSAEAEGQQNKLLIQSRNANLSYAERIKLIKQASEIEKQNHSQALAIAKEEERIAREELALIDKNMTDRGDAAKKYAEAQANRIKLENESANIQEKLINRIDALNQQKAEKDKARLDKRTAEIKAAAEAEYKAIVDAAKAKQDAENEREAAYQKYLESQKRATEAENEAKLQAIEQMADEDEQKKAKLEFELEQRKMHLLSLQQAEEEYAIRNGESTAAIQQKYADLKLGAEAKYAADVLKVDKDKADRQKKIDDAATQAKLNNLQATASTLGALSNLAGKGTVAGKTLAVAQATIDTFVGANKAIAQGGIAGAIAAVGIIATGLANVTSIISTEVPTTTLDTNIKVSPASVGGSTGGSVAAGPPPPKPSMFAFGGLLNGPRHMNGGIMTPFGEMEGGEYVVNRRSTAAFLPILENINNAGLGEGGGIGDVDARIDQAIANQNQSPIIKTYVVASDVENQLEAQKMIRNLSTL